jgi:hypothetical protein
VAVLRGFQDTVAALRASLGYVVRNAPDLAGFAGDFARGRLGWRLPPARVIYGLKPDRIAAIVNDAVVWAEGWPDVGTRRVGAARSGGEPAVIAVPGPFAAPGHCTDGEVVVAPEVASLLGVTQHAGPMAVVMDRYNGPGPAAKQGTLVRGIASPLGHGRFVLCSETIAEWHGVNVTSRPVDRTDHNAAASR